MPAVLFGSISTVADTSELQRQAFNDAFEAHGLDWSWDREEYVALLEKNGGSDRVARYAAARGEEVDAAAVHRLKSELFRQRLVEQGVTARPGVLETVAAAREQGLRLGLVTTTSAENVAALDAALGDSLDLASFDVVIDAAQVEQPKPDPAAYLLALERLGEPAGSAVAVEDNVGGVAAASAAGVACVAFPNQNTAGHAFDGAAARVEVLDLDGLRATLSH